LGLIPERQRFFATGAKPSCRFRDRASDRLMAAGGRKLDIAPLANFPDGAPVTDQLYIFLAEAIATEATDKRPGARHALMLYASGSTLDWARGRATKHADDAGWLHVEVKREKELNRDTSLIAEPTLRTAADAAVARGSAIVIYGNEIPTHS